jgi:hypothetical protein
MSIESPLTEKAETTCHELRFRLTFKLSRRGHAVLRLANCGSGALDRAISPAGFIGHGRLQLRQRGAQVLERLTHVRLIGPGGRQAKGGNRQQTDNYRSKCFHCRVVRRHFRVVKKQCVTK